jgi:hypothetical protein
VLDVGVEEIQAERWGFWDVLLHESSFSWGGTVLYDGSGRMMSVYDQE